MFSSDFGALSVIEIVTGSLGRGNAGAMPANITEIGLAEVFRTAMVAFWLGWGSTVRIE